MLSRALPKLAKVKLSGISKNRAWDLFPLLLKPGEVRTGYSKDPLLGAEDFADFATRVASVFSTIVAEAAKDGVHSIAIVTHGTFLRALLTEHLELTLPEDWKHGSVLLLEYHPAKAAIAPL